MTTGEIVSPWAVAYSVGVFGLLMILTYFDIDYHEARSPSQEFLHSNVIKFIPIAMILSVIGYALHSITIPHGRRGNRSFRASAWICAAALIGGLIVTWATGTGEKMASDIS
jgi:branched-subunit amino acid transport protein AzlD